MRPKSHRQSISPPCPSRQSRPCRSPDSGASDRVADRLSPSPLPPALPLEFTSMTHTECQRTALVNPSASGLSPCLLRYDAKQSAGANEAPPAVEKRLTHRHERLDLGAVG